MSVPEEHILVIPESVIEQIGTIEGFESDVDKFLVPILGSQELSFQPRGAMETDPSYKQLIPYVLLEWTDGDGVIRLFAYTRGGGGGESRLHARAPWPRARAAVVCELRSWSWSRNFHRHGRSQRVTRQTQRTVDRAFGWLGVELK